MRRLDTILKMRVTNPESAPTELAEDTVLEALFKVHVEPQLDQCMCTKRHYSIHTTEAADEARVIKRERG